MSKIVALHPTDPIIDPELVALAEQMLKRVQDGITIGLGIIEHQIGDVVTVEVRGGASYHHLNSGTTRLSHLINDIGWEKGKHRMNTAITPQKASEIIEAVIAKGDISQLTPQEKARYYVRVCESIGLNPMTRPFEYITLNGKLVLYARKDCTDQLRSIYGVSVIDLSERERDGVFTIVAKVVDKDGRTDVATGAVNIKSLQGENLANAMMKAETKAKRRATLSICGLGFLDEFELPATASSVPAAPPQNRPRLADKLNALGTAPDIEPTRPKRGRPRKDDEPTDEEITQSQARLAELLEEEPLTGEEPELQTETPDDGWLGVRHDYEQGKRDAVAGYTDCLNRDIRDVAARYAEWRKGFDSVKKNR